MLGKGSLLGRARRRESEAGLGRSRNKLEIAVTTPYHCSHSAKYGQSWGLTGATNPPTFAERSPHSAFSISVNKPNLPSLPTVTTAPAAGPVLARRVDGSEHSASERHLPQGMSVHPITGW